MSDKNRFLSAETQPRSVNLAPIVYKRQATWPFNSQATVPQEATKL